MHVVVDLINNRLDILSKTVRNEIAQDATEDERHRVNKGVAQPVNQNISMQLRPNTSNFLHTKVLHVDVEVGDVDQEIRVNDKLIGATF